MHVEGLPAAVSVFAGAYSSCALTVDGEIWCWGGLNVGQNFGAAAADAGAFPTPTVVARFNGVKEFRSATVLLDAGYVDNWGMNNKGQLGIGSVDQEIHNLPVQVSGLDSVTQISSELARCALRIDGTVWCWGDNSQGGLGVSLPNGESYSATPVPVAGLDNATAIDGSGCAVQATGGVVCWGDNSSGQMGLRDDTSPETVVTAPTQVPDLGDATQVTAQYFNTCVLRKSGQVSCAGDNNACEVDFTCATQAPVREFRAIAGLNGVKKVAVGSQFMCAIEDTDELSCWGLNLWGELGRGNGNSAPTYPATIEPVRWP
jgi:alpha-tubulin suppressor-like RCC1 family protein